MKEIKGKINQINVKMRLMQNALHNLSEEINNSHLKTLAFNMSVIQSEINKKLEYKGYPVRYQKGTLSIEDKNLCDLHGKDVELGVQVAHDGRVWVCINGQAFIRFKPKGET